MQVETFECHETASEPIEACEEALALVEKLGLTGQQTLKAKLESGFDVRCPYREMTKDEAWVYRVLCPEESKLTEYSRTPIPLRVLQVAAHAQSLGIFRELLVWDRAKAAVKDPVLVGVRQNKPGESWNTSHFILARWGEELEAFVVLAKRAFEHKRKSLTDKLRAIVAEATADLSRAEFMTDEELMQRNPSQSASYYIA